MAFNPLEQFQIVPLISLHIGAVDFSFTNSALAALGASFFSFYSEDLSSLQVKVVLFQVDGNL